MAIFSFSTINATGIVAPIQDADIGRINQIAVGTPGDFTILNKADLDSLLGLTSGGDASGSHHHDSQYFTQSQLTSSVVGATGADLISATAIINGSATTIQGVFSELETKINELSSITMEWQRSVIDKDITTPPLSPLVGDRYLIGLIPGSGIATGAWDGNDGDLTEWDGSQWQFTQPEVGMFVTADDETTAGTVYFFNGTQWQDQAFESTTASGFLIKDGQDIQLKNLTVNHLIVGDANQEAVSFDTNALGEIVASDAGLFIKSNLIEDDKINANAEILLSKLELGTPGQIVVYDSTGVQSVASMTGDISISDIGVTSIQPSAVKDSMIDFGLNVGQVNDEDLPSNATVINYIDGLTVKDQLENIDTKFGTVDSDINGKVSKSGDTMTGALDMNSNKITNIPNGSDPGDSVNFSQLSSLQGDTDGKVSKAGDTMFGNLIMSDDGGVNRYQVKQLESGTDTNDAVNKGQLDLKINLSEKGAANGVATLDANSKIPTSQLPALAISEISVVADITARDALVVQEGDVAKVLDADGSGNPETFIYDGASWVSLKSDDLVDSVNGQIGTVSLNTDDVPEGSTNLYYTQARFDNAFTAKSTTDLSEGTNLYYTDERVDDRVATLIQDGTGISWTYDDPNNLLTGNVNLTPFTTDDLAQGTNNRYYASSLFDTDFASKTTDDLSEGIVNLYYSSGLFDTDFATKTTDDLAEGASNFYYTETKFDSSLAGKTTDDIAEGVTNLYFTEARAKSAAVVNSTAGNEIDQAPSVDSIKAYIASQIPTDEEEQKELTSIDITNGYIDLQNEAIEKSIILFPDGGLLQQRTVSYIVSVVGGVTRITWQGELANDLQQGDVLIINYRY